MAKQASVLLNVAIEKMRGKLATKQQDIMYSSQKTNQTPFDLADGRHPSTNFDNYIVLTQRRGKQMFFVKSRTTLGMTAATRSAQAIMALAATYAAYAEKVIMTRPEPRYLQFLESWAYYRTGDMTLREYIMTTIIPQMRQPAENFEFPTVPATPTSEPTLQTLGANPYYNGVIEISNADYLAQFINTGKSAAAFQKYFYALSAITALNIYEITVHSKDLRKQKIRILCDSATTMSELTACVQGRAFRLVESTDQNFFTNITVYNSLGKIFDSGVPYTDSTRTTPLAKDTEIGTFTDIYLQRT